MLLRPLLRFIRPSPIPAYNLSEMQNKSITDYMKSNKKSASKEPKDATDTVADDDKKVSKQLDPIE